MAAQFLYLTNDKLIAITKRGDAILSRESFVAADLSGDDFMQYLHRNKAIPTQVYVDLIEEDFRIDTIPHLRGGDQRDVIERRLGQLYRTSPFRHATVQGREEEGRKDDRVFFHAITNPDLLKSLLSAMDAAQVPLEGVSSAPVLSHQLLKALDLVFPHTLLVSIVPDFGLRQTYFQGNLIKFSRITPISYDEGQSVGSLIAAETSRTWQYLDSLRFFTPEDSLEVCILVHERDRTMIADAIRSYPLLRFRFLEIGEVSAKVKLDPAPNSSHAHEVLVQLFSRTKSQNHYATKESTRFGAFRRARIALFAVTALILAAGIGWTGFNIYQATYVANRIETRNRDERSLRAEYQSISALIREQKFATEAVRDSSIFFNSQIRPIPASPGPLVRTVARIFADHPNLVLDRLTWAASNGIGSPISLQLPPPSGALYISSTGSNQNPPPLKSPTAPTPLGTGAMGVIGALAAGANIPMTEPQKTVVVAPVAANEPDPTFAGNKFHHLIVEASIKTYDGNFRKMQAEVETFAQELAALKGAQVTVLQRPVDVSPNAILKVENAGVRTPTFVLRISYRVEGT